MNEAAEKDVTATETGEDQDLSQETQAVETAEHNYQSPTIAELFGGEKPAEPEKDVEPEPAVTEETEEAETETVEAEPEKSEEEPKAKEESDRDSIIKEKDAFRAAMFEERAKRKELEERLKAQTTEPETDDSYVDPDTKRYVDGQLLKKDNEIMMMKLKMSQAMARAQFKDYDDVVKNFTDAAENNPKLLDAAVATDNPAFYAYQEGKKIRFSKEYGDNPEEIEKKMEAKLREKIKKDLEKELMTKVAAKSKQPTNLSKVRAAGGDRETDWEPAKVGDLFKR